MTDENDIKDPELKDPELKDPIGDLLAGIDMLNDERNVAEGTAKRELQAELEKQYTARWNKIQDFDAYERPLHTNAVLRVLSPHERQRERWCHYAAGSGLGSTELSGEYADRMLIEEEKRFGKDVP